MRPLLRLKTLPNLLALRSLSAAVSQRLPELEAPLQDRPLDIHFIGTLNPRREVFFCAECAVAQSVSMLFYIFRRWAYR